MKQFIKFGMIGGLNSIINYVIYVICINAGMHYVMANIIGFIIVIFFAYLLQNMFVFSDNEHNEKQPWWKVLIKTYMSYALTGFFLTNILSFLWLDVLDLISILKPIYQISLKYFCWQDEYTFEKYMVPFINMIFIVPINFLLNKYWTYRGSREK